MSVSTSNMLGRIALVLMLTVATAVAQDKCCQGSVTARNDSLAVPSNCPSVTTIAPADGQWQTSNNAACPTSQPNCLRILCSSDGADKVTRYTLSQFCHTNIDDAIAQTKKAGNNMIVPVAMTCTSAGAWLRPTASVTLLLALVLASALN